jgi:hypothetical protein
MCKNYKPDAQFNVESKNLEQSLCRHIELNLEGNAVEAPRRRRELANYQFELDRRAPDRN